jgi:tRNA (pseudouridine54-N1)-methyltransferase
VRRFVVIGQRASASPDFSLSDIPSTSGRLDVLIRCLRAALLISHGVRRDTIVYLCLLGSADRPRSLRFDGPAARYMRPDERSLATVIKKCLAANGGGSEFSEVRPGIAIAEGGVERVLSELGETRLYLLEEGAADLRDRVVGAADSCFVLGDHLGMTPEVRGLLLERGAEPVSVGPVSLHAEDVITLVANELDRRGTP